jgi:hypothetical protein
MSKIDPTIEEVGIVEAISNPEAEPRPTSGRPDESDLFSRAKKIREELGILDGQVALTFLDDGT